MPSLLTLVSTSGLFDAAIKSAVFLLLAVIATAALGRQSAACRHLVWCLSIAGLLLFPVLSLTLPHWRMTVLPQWTTTPTQFAAGEHTEIAAANLNPPLADAAIIIPPSASRSETVPPNAPLDQPPATLGTASPRRSAMPWLAIAWLAGGLMSLVPLAIGLWQLTGLHRRSQLVGDHRWLTLLDELRRQLGIRRGVQLRQCESPLAPFTWGMLRPVLLVPFESDAWPEERRRLVLLHELAHIRRWDWLTQLVAQVACALYWFNPFVWFAAKQMRIERERACDDIVLASGARPSDYARELLALAAGLSDLQLSSLVAVPMARRANLDDRLGGILDSRRNRRPLTRSAGCLGAALAAAVMAPLAMLHAAPPESTESEPREQREQRQQLRSPAAVPESTESEPAAPTEGPPEQHVEPLEMTVNTSRTLTIGTTVPRAQVDNPEVAEITAVSGTKVRVTAKKPGTTQVNLFDEDDNVYTVETIVYPDARELRVSSRRRSRTEPGLAGRKAEPAADGRYALALGSNPEVKEIWDLTMAEAVRTGLANSKVLRNLGGRLITPVGPQSNLNPDPHGPVEGARARRGTKVGFVLVRTNEQIALADFKAGVRNVVSDLERAYWDLYYNDRNLNAVQAGRDSALKTWRKVHDLYVSGAKGGEAEKEAQAREQYFIFRAQVENTLGLLYTAESRLRYMMGLGPDDGRLIRPTDEPTADEVRFDWKEVLREALTPSVKNAETELDLAHRLTNSLRDLDRNYQVSRTTFNRRKAAAKQLEAVTATYEMGTATLDMLLDAQRRLADAENAYYHALVDYNLAILQVHFLKGSLLEYHGILLTEGKIEAGR